MTTGRQVVTRTARPVRAPGGVYVVTTKPIPARPVLLARRPRPGHWALIATAIVVPWAVVLALLAWQPAWTLGTIVAILVVLVAGTRRGHGGTVVDVVTRVRVKR